MARIPKLDSAGRFLAADVNAQIDARAKAAAAPLLDGKRGVEATELGTEHLDTVTTPGTYTQSANLEATLESGYPMTRGGVLQVERSVSKTMVWQTFTTYATSATTPPQTWQRGSYNGTWTPWTKVGGAMPDGGQPGQVLTTGTDGKATWQAPAATSAIKVGGTQPTSGWWLDSGNVYVTPTPDTVAPVAGTLAVTTTSSKATLTVAGASDDRALNAAPYSFSKDNGITWSGWQSAPTFEFTGLAQDTTFTFRHRVRDAEGNVAVGVAVVKPTNVAASAFRDAMLELAPTLYYPMDWPAGFDRGPLLSNLKSIGSDPSAPTIATNLTFGAETLGDGPYSAAATAGEMKGTATAMQGAAQFTVLGLFDITAAAGAGLGSGWGAGQASIDVQTSGNVMANFNGVNAGVVKPASVSGKHFLAVTYDGAIGRVFWDGQQIGSSAVAGMVLPTSTSISTWRGTGRLSSCASWKDRALTPTQITDLYSKLAW